MFLSFVEPASPGSAFGAVAFESLLADLVEVMAFGKYVEGDWSNTNCAPPGFGEEAADFEVGDHFVPRGAGHRGRGVQVCFGCKPVVGDEFVDAAKVVAEHLRALGLEVKTGVAKTGVIGLLQTGRPGPVVLALAD